MKLGSVATPATYVMELFDVHPVWGLTSFCSPLPHDPAFRPFSSPTSWGSCLVATEGVRLAWIQAAPLTAYGGNRSQWTESPISKKHRRPRGRRCVRLEIRGPRGREERKNRLPRRKANKPGVDPCNQRGRSNCRGRSKGCFHHSIQCGSRQLV